MVVMDDLFLADPVLLLLITMDINGSFMLEIITGFQIVPAKSGEVFDYNTVYFSRLDILKHMAELRTLEIGSCPSVINIYLPQFQVRMLQDIIPKQSNLCLHGISIFLTEILDREPAVNTGLEFLLFGWSRYAGIFFFSYL